MRLLFRQIRSVRRHRDQGPQHGPEGIELTPPKNRVDRLDPIDELLACVLGHMVFMADPELSLCGSRGILMMRPRASQDYDFGISFPGSMKGFLTMTAVRGPAGCRTINSVPRSARSLGTIA